jgi:hypothetical protein
MKKLLPFLVAVTALASVLALASVGAVPIMHNRLARPIVVPAEPTMTVSQVSFMLEQLAWNLDQQGYASGMYGQLFPDSKEQNKGRMEAYRSAAAQVRQLLPLVLSSDEHFVGVSGEVLQRD